MRLIISTRSTGRPALVDTDADRRKPFVEYREWREASRAAMLLQEIAPSARHLTGEQLHEIAGEMCKRLHGHADFHTLVPVRYQCLLAHARALLQGDD